MSLFYSIKLAILDYDINKDMKVGSARKKTKTTRTKNPFAEPILHSVKKKIMSNPWNSFTKVKYFLPRVTASIAFILER